MLPGSPEVILGVESNQLLAAVAEGVPYGFEDGEGDNEDSESHADGRQDEPGSEPFGLVYQVDPGAAARESLEEA